MTLPDAVDVLSIADNARAAELTIRALKKRQPATGYSWLRTAPLRWTSSSAAANTLSGRRLAIPRSCCST